MHLFAPSGMPYYLFTHVDDASQPLLARLLRDALDGLPERLPPPFSPFRATALQLAAGGRGSGSPAHFHDDAFNILLAGRKRWWLWPPSEAAMSREHPSRLAARGGACGARELVQEPGDVLYVPNGWGHAVLNLADYNLCVAVEFEG